MSEYRLLNKAQPLGISPERKFASDGHLSPPRTGGKQIRILPVIHPAEHYRFIPTRQAVECQCAIAIFAIVGPERLRRRIFVHKARAIEPADEILFTRATLDATGIEPDF